MKREEKELSVDKPLREKIYGYIEECPKCGSENISSYDVAVLDVENHDDIHDVWTCLDCGFEWLGD